MTDTLTACEVMTSEATQIYVCVASSSLWWAMPVVGFLGVCVAATGAFIAWRALLANREMARKRATLDYIERSESTEYYQKRYSAFRDARNASSDLSDLFDPKNDALKTQRRLVLDFFNHYELIASGIKFGILDEKIYKSYMRSTVVRDWRAGQPLVEHIRTPTPDSGQDVPADLAFSEFQALAEKWEREMRRSGVL